MFVLHAQALVGKASHRHGACVCEPATTSLCYGCLQRGYDGELLGGTFSRAVFVGNGLVAIVAGLVAHTLVETLALGPVIPFDTAAVVMICGGVIVLFTWTENFGNSSEKRNFLEQLKNGAHAIANGETCVLAKGHLIGSCAVPTTSNGAACTPRIH